MTVEGDELRERIARLEAECKADRELTDEKFRGRDHALGLQAKEVERRLGDLNHEATRIARAANLSVSQEVYAANREADRLLFTGINRKLDNDTGGAIGRRELVTWLFGATTLILAFLGATGHLG